MYPWRLRQGTFHKHLIMVCSTKLMEVEDWSAEIVCLVKLFKFAIAYEDELVKKKYRDNSISYLIMFSGWFCHIR